MRIVLAALVMLVLCRPTYAQTFNIEEDASYKPLSSTIKQAIQSSGNNSWDKDALQGCDLVGAPIDLTLKGKTNGYIASTNGCGGGSAAFPVWLVSYINDIPRVVLSYGAVTIKIDHRRTNGLRDVIATQSNTGHCETIKLKFDGKRYAEVGRKKCNP